MANEQTSADRLMQDETSTPEALPPRFLGKPVGAPLCWLVEMPGQQSHFQITAEAPQESLEGVAERWWCRQVDELIEWSVTQTTPDLIGA